MTKLFDNIHPASIYIHNDSIINIHPASVNINIQYISKYVVNKTSYDKIKHHMIKKLIINIV